MRLRDSSAWAAVHQWSLGAGVIGFVALASALLGGQAIESVGFVRFLAPVSTLLFLPVGAGVGVAVASMNEANLPLPNPWRAVLARTAWLVCWTLVAVMAASLGTAWAQADATVGAVARNVCLYSALSVAAVCVGLNHLVWLPSVTYALACMLFGAPPGQPGYYWWAFALDGTTRPEHAWFTAWACGLVLLAYGVWGPKRIYT